MNERERIDQIRISARAQAAAKKAKKQETAFTKTFQEVFVTDNDVTSMHIAKVISKSGFNNKLDKAAAEEVRIH
jgi:hypothetical protein